jgi:hypothetical protein
VGGEFQGKGVIPNAKSTYVSNDSTVLADSTWQGNGGRIIVWADKDTNFSGNATARGGVNAGDGGFVEISGKQNLAFQGKVNVDAPLGQLGSVLFDPRDIYIVDTANLAIGPDNSDQLNVNVPNAGDLLGSILFADGGIDFQITRAALEGIDGNITLQASRNINLNTSLVFPTRVGLNSQIGRTIKFEARGDLGELSGFKGAGQNITAFGQNIEISGKNITIGSINTSIQNQGQINAGNISLTAVNDINVASSGGNGTSLNAFSINQSGDGGSAGFITLNSDVGNISVGGLVQSFVFSSGTAAPGGVVTIKAPEGKVSTGAIYSFSESSVKGNSGNGGDVEIYSKNDLVIIPDPNIQDLPENKDTGIRSLSRTNDGSSSKAGSITLTSTSEAISAGDIDAESQLQPNCSTGNCTAGDGGKIKIKAEKKVTLKAVNNFSNAQSGNSGNADTISIASTSSDVITDDINSYTTSLQGKSGSATAITVQAPAGSIATGDIFTYSKSFTSDSGNSGNITLNAGKNATVGFLQAFNSAPAQATSGSAGVVNITTVEFFRNTKLDPSKDPELLCFGASMCAAGGSSGGTVSIRHGGGLTNIPFTIGDSSVNGTQGHIIARSDRLDSPKEIKGSYFSPPPITSGIQITTQSPPVGNLPILDPLIPDPGIVVPNPDPVIVVPPDLPEKKIHFQ